MVTRTAHRLARRLIMSMLLAGVVVSGPGVTAAEQQVEIRALFNPVTYDVEYLNWLDDVWLPAFEEAHPGVTVTMTHLSGNRQDAVAVAIAAGVPYDIIDAPHTPTFTESAGENWYLPLDPYIANWEHADQVLPGVWSHTQWDGVTYAIPHRVAPRTIVYNKDLFREAGMDPEAPPMSWDEMLAVSSRLVRTQGQNLVRRGFHMRDTNGDMAVTFGLFTRNNGGRILSEDARSIRFDQAPGREALNFMREIYEVNNPGGFSRDLYPSQNRAFTSEQAAMVPLAGTGTLRTIAQDFADEIDPGIFVPRASGEHQPAMTASINSIAIVRFTEHPDIAWQVLEHLMEPESLEMYAFYRGQLIPRRDLLPFFNSNMPELAPVVALMDFLVPRPKWATGGGYSYTSALGEPVITAVHGEISPEAAMDEARRRVQIMLDAFWETID